MGTVHYKCIFITFCSISFSIKTTKRRESFTKQLSSFLTYCREFHFMEAKTNIYVMANETTAELEVKWKTCTTILNVLRRHYRRCLDVGQKN